MTETFHMRFYYERGAYYYERWKRFHGKLITNIYKVIFLPEKVVSAVELSVPRKAFVGEGDFTFVANDAFRVPRPIQHIHQKPGRKGKRGGGRERGRDED